MARKFTSLYKDDPIAEELEAGIRGTDVYQGSPYALGNVPGFEGMKTATTDYNRYQDLYNLYLGGGFDAAQDDFPIQAEDITGGTGTGGTGTTTGGTGGVNTPEEQRLIDAGIGLQVAPGQPVFAPGEEPVTQADIDAFNQIPVNTEYKSPYDTGDANIAEQIAAKDRAAQTIYDPTTMMPQLGSETPSYAGGERTLEDAGAGIDGMYQTDYFPEYQEPQSMLASDMIAQRNKELAEAASGPKGRAAFGTVDRTPVPEASQALDDEYYEFDTPKTTVGDDLEPFGTDVDITQGFVDVPNVRDQLVTAADAADPGFFKRLGINIDPAEAAVKAALNMAVGKPVSVLIDILKNILPEMDPRQKALREHYNIDDIGRVAEGELMAGYNPVYGGFPGISDPTYGLQDAYQKRIDTITKTLAKQKADGKTQSQDLIDRLAELKEAKAKEFTMLDEVTDKMGDVEDRDLYHDVIAQEEAARKETARKEAEAMEAARIAEIDRVNRVKEAEAVAVAKAKAEAQRAKDDAARFISRHHDPPPDRSTPTNVGSPWGGGHRYAKGGIVDL